MSKRCVVMNERKMFKFAKFLVFPVLLHARLYVQKELHYLCVVRSNCVMSNAVIIFKSGNVTIIPSLKVDCVCSYFI